MEAKKKRIEELKGVLAKEAPYEEAIQCFYSLRKLLRFSHPFFTKAIQGLYHQALERAQLTHSGKHYSDAYQLMKSYLYHFPQWYHMAAGQKFHALLLWKCAEMGKLAMHLGKLKKAMEYTERAVAILEKSRLSADFEEVRELRQRHEQLQIECRINATSCRK